ncbi:MAG TPA: efflux RND transporter periplasmic adaptor subunit [Gemmatimonadaceae bacterium]|nr:efflux RND transporter periplasmic adaptor subunit [Gemmatimonadaceae bacterium]
MNRRLRFHARTLVAVSLATALLVACNGDGEEGNGDSSAASAASDSGAAADAPSTTRLALPVAAMPVREGDLVLTVSTTGQVAAEEIATLKAEVAGTVDRVLVRAGDRVRKGQPLVMLDPRPLDIAVKEADANVERAMVQYRDYYYPDSVVTGRAPTEEQRKTAIARSGLASAEVALERAKYEREKATVVSPFDGLVDQVKVAPGMRVGTGEELTRIVNTSLLRIEAQVLEHDLHLIREGGEAIISSAAAPDRQIRGRVVAVLPTVDTTRRAGRAFVRVPANTLLRPGMYADVKLEATRLSKRRIVPTRAIIQRDNRPLVFVVRDGRAQWVYINPGRSNGVETEVLPDSGTGLIPVEVGDDVIVSGHLTLTHDAPVRVVAVADSGSSLPIKP